MSEAMKRKESIFIFANNYFSFEFPHNIKCFKKILNKLSMPMELRNLGENLIIFQSAKDTWDLVFFV